MASLTARRCVVCDAEATKRCSSCAKAGLDLFFCSLEHFAKVWSGHKKLCGRKSAFLYQPTGRDIAAARAQFAAPLKQTVVKRLVHLLWGTTKQNYRSLAGLQLRRMIKEDWGFDPAQEGPELVNPGSNEVAGSVAHDLKEMFGVPAESLLNFLEHLGPDEPDLVPFRDVLIAGIQSINPFPPWYPLEWKVYHDICQLHSMLLFSAATEWLAFRHKAGEPAIDPTHELWWQLLNHRIALSFYHGGALLSEAATYSKLAFETTCKWMRRGMDLDDPQLAEVFAHELLPYVMAPTHMWPSGLTAAVRRLVEAKKTKKVKSGSAKVKVKLVQTRS